MVCDCDRAFERWQRVSESAALAIDLAERERREQHAPCATDLFRCRGRAACAHRRFLELSEDSQGTREPGVIDGVGGHGSADYAALDRMWVVACLTKQLDARRVLSGEVRPDAEILSRGNAKSHVVRRLGERPRAPVTHASVGEISDEPLVLTDIEGDPPEPPRVAERLRQLFRFREHDGVPGGVAEKKEGCTQIDPKIDRLRVALARLRQVRQRRQGLFEMRDRLPVRRLAPRLVGGDSQISHRFFPALPLHRVMAEGLRVLGQPVRVEAFDGVHDAGVQGLAPFREQGAVRDVMGERVLEGVLGIRSQARLVQKLGSLQVVEPATERLLGEVGDRPGAARMARPCRRRRRPA